MQIPEDWNNVEPIRIHRPREGYYILKIINVTEGYSKNQGNELMLLEFDILEGEFKDFFTTMGAKINKNILLKYRQLTQKKEALPYLKKLILDIEASNIGYKFDFNVNTLRGKKVGAYLKKDTYISNFGPKEILMIDKIFNVADVRNALSTNVVNEIKNKQDTNKQRDYFNKSQHETFDDLPFN